MNSHDDSGGPPDALEMTRAAAEAFGLALDGGDLAVVQQLLAAECACVEGGSRILGVGSVMALLRAAVRWAERSFDEVRSFSTLVDVSAGIARLDVVMVWMRVPGRWHRLCFERALAVRPGGKIGCFTNTCDAAAAAAFANFASESGAPPVPLGFGVRPEG